MAVTRDSQGFSGLGTGATSPAITLADTTSGSSVAIGVDSADSGKFKVFSSTNNPTVLTGAQFSIDPATNGHIVLDPNGSGTVDIIGISSINAGSVASVVSIGSSEQLGSTVITAGTGITVTPGANTITISSSGGSGGVIVTSFTGSGTWNKDVNTKYVTVLGWGGGGSGGSGRRATTATSGGGSGGAGAGFFQVSSPASFFNSSETVTIGSGASVTAGQTSDNTNGNLGGVGGDTSFGNIIVSGGGAGKAGTVGTVTGQAGALSSVNYAASPAVLTSGAGTITTGSNGAIVALIANSACGGSGGGGSGANSVTPQQAGNGALIRDTNSNTLLAGGAGGIETGTIDGGMGNNQLSTGGAMMGGSGGGGGGGQSSGIVAGNGGQGGFPGGGGGAGGGSLNGTTSGSGGAGGNGKVIVIEFT